MDMAPVNQPVTPKTSQKKDKQKAHATDDKQIKNQLVLRTSQAKRGLISSRVDYESNNFYTRDIESSHESITSRVKSEPPIKLDSILFFLF
jgi:hypothetical protein